MATLADLSLSVDTDTVSRALQWLEAAGVTAGLPDRTRFKLRLCMDETLTNITLYGFPPEHARTIEPCVKLRLDQQDQHLILLIMDNGVAFDPTKQTSRDLDASLDDALIGGHGLRLMRHYLADIRYERRGDWNHLELFAAIDAESSA